MPFPVREKYDTHKNRTPSGRIYFWADLTGHSNFLTEAVAIVVEKIARTVPCGRSVGFLRLLQVDHVWVPLELRYGIPLFDGRLNAAVCEHARRAGTFASEENVAEHAREQQELVLRLLAFVAAYAASTVCLVAESDVDAICPQPGRTLLFYQGRLSWYDL
jgi:hypothetical protein